MALPKKGETQIRSENRCMTGTVNIYICSEAVESKEQRQKRDADSETSLAPKEPEDRPKSTGLPKSDKRNNDGDMKFITEAATDVTSHQNTEKKKKIEDAPSYPNTEKKKEFEDNISYPNTEKRKKNPSSSTVKKLENNSSFSDVKNRENSLPPSNEIKLNFPESHDKIETRQKRSFDKAASTYQAKDINVEHTISQLEDSDDKIEKPLIEVPILYCTCPDMKVYSSDKTCTCDRTDRQIEKSVLQKKNYEELCTCFCRDVDAKRADVSIQAENKSARKKHKSKKKNPSSAETKGKSSFFSKVTSKMKSRKEKSKEDETCVPGCTGKPDSEKKQR